MFFVLLLSGSLSLYAQADNPRAKQKHELDNASADTLKISLLLKLSKSYADAVHVKKATDDTAFIYATQALALSRRIKNLSLTGDCYDRLARIYEHAKNITHARIYEHLAIDSYLHDHNIRQTGDAYRQLGRLYGYEPPAELAERIKADTAALVCYVKLKDKIKQAETLQELGDLYSYSDHVNTAILLLKQALELYNSVHYKKTQGIYLLLNGCYHQLGDLKQAVNYGLAAIKAAEIVKDSSSQLSVIYNYLGIEYLEMDQLEKAAMYFKLSVQNAKRNNDRTLCETASLYLSNTLFKLNRGPEALNALRVVTWPTNGQSKTIMAVGYLCVYTLLKQWDLAEKYYKETISYCKKSDNNSYIKQSACAALILYYFQLKKYKDARWAANQYNTVAQNLRIQKAIIIAQHWMFRLDSAENNYLSAIKHIQQEKILQDSLINESKAKNISQLEIQYETEKKEHQLQINSQHIQLLIKQSQLQQAGLQNAALIRNVIIAGTFMLAILLFVSYNRYQIKQRSNIQLQQKQELINKKNNVLERLVSDKDLLLVEKEWLLKEIHHRVKNNLQIVISLLNSQSSYLSDDGALNAIRESQHRMHSISLIHQKLYQSDNLAQIDMVDYIVELTTYLQHSFGAERSIDFELLIEPISLDVAQAVPVGLILNEAVTNAIKYAFTLGKKGKIIIGLDEPTRDSVELIISDNGPGLPENFDFSQSTSLGMSLMKGLCRQLNGELNFTSHNGLTLRLTIPTKVIIMEENYTAG